MSISTARAADNESGFCMNGAQPEEKRSPAQSPEDVFRCKLEKFSITSEDLSTLDGKSAENIQSAFSESAFDFPKDAYPRIFFIDNEGKLVKAEFGGTPAISIGTVDQIRPEETDCLSPQAALYLAKHPEVLPQKQRPVLMQRLLDTLMKSIKGVFRIR